MFDYDCNTSLPLKINHAKCKVLSSEIGWSRETIDIYLDILETIGNIDTAPLKVMARHVFTHHGKTTK